MQVTSCFGCCSTKAGTIIVAIINIISSIILMVLTLAVKIEWNELLSDTYSHTAKIINTIFYCIEIFITIILLVGVFKRNTCMILPWLVLGVYSTISGLITVLTKTIMLFMISVEQPAAVLFVGYLISITFLLYSWLVVYSYYQQLKSGNRNDRFLHEKLPNCQEA